MTSHYTHRLELLHISSLFRYIIKSTAFHKHRSREKFSPRVLYFLWKRRHRGDQESKVSWGVYGRIRLGGGDIIWSHREQIRIIKRKWHPLSHVQGPQNWLPASMPVLSSQPGFDLAESLTADSAHAPSAWFILAPVGPSWGKAHLGMFNTFPCQAGERAALAE